MQYQTEHNTCVVNSFPFLSCPRSLTHYVIVVQKKSKRMNKNGREESGVWGQRRMHEHRHTHTHTCRQREGERKSFIDLRTIAKTTVNSRCSSKNEVNKLCSRNITNDKSLIWMENHSFEISNWYGRVSGNYIHIYFMRIWCILKKTKAHDHHWPMAIRYTQVNYCIIY